jgi:hypothetical protein
LTNSAAKTSPNTKSKPKENSPVIQASGLGRPHAPRLTR